MARLVPEDFPLDAISHDTERDVVQALRGLPDSWFIIPNLRVLAYNVERELDIVLIHPAMGVVLVEVKGFIPEVRGGLWFGDDGSPQSSPFKQAIQNSFGLRDRLRTIPGVPAMDRVPSAVAFPRASAFTGRLPEDREWFHVLLGPDLASRDLLAEKLDMLVSSGEVFDGLGVDGVNAIINELAPDAHFVWDADGEHRRARTMLRTLSDQQVEGFASLDANRRVFVRGRAGTGKTSLARSWVRRAAADRGERVLLTCYHEPLGRTFRRDFADIDEVTAGPFLQVCLGLPGAPKLEDLEPDASSAEITTWWNETVPDFARAYLSRAGGRFDTIVIDEVQDFMPPWLEVAEMMLDPAGPRRMLLLGDGLQDIHGRGFVEPSPDHGWVVAEMPRNCRNADVIATLLRRRLDGAKPSPAAPPGWACRFIEVNDLVTATGVIDTLLSGYAGNGRDPASVGVVATSSRLRDELAKALGLDIDPNGLTTCVGTPHRLKGLEFDSVVLAVDPHAMDDVRLYIGISRAVSELVIVGPAEVAQRLGLPHSTL